MPRPSTSAKFLALFTSPERAESIVGDLTEESHARGRLCFGVRIIRVAMALFRNAFLQAPLKSTAISAATFLALELMAVITLRILLLAPMEYRPLLAVVLPILSSFLIGWALIRLAPTFGIRSLPGFAVLTLTAIVIVNFQFPYAVTQRLTGILFMASLYMIPLLAASVLTRNRMLKIIE